MVYGNVVPLWHDIMTQKWPEVLKDSLFSLNWEWPFMSPKTKKKKKQCLLSLVTLDQFSAKPSRWIHNPKRKSNILLQSNKQNHPNITAFFLENLLFSLCQECLAQLRFWRTVVKYFCTRINIPSLNLKDLIAWGFLYWSFWGNLKSSSNTLNPCILY